jgi:uncharacterized DUF497 family protein
MVTVKEPIEFIWDKGNIDKNWRKHQVSNRECEEVFYDNKKKIYKDKLHSGKEERFILIGKTKKERLLYSVFTIRGNKIRVISSRDINKKERRLY